MLYLVINYYKINKNRFKYKILNILYIMSNIFIDNTMNITYRCINKRLYGKDRGCNTLGTERNDKDYVFVAIQNLPQLSNGIYENVDVSKITTQELVKRRAYRNYLLSLQDINNCKPKRNNRKVFINGTHKQGFYYLVSNNSGVKTYDYYRRMNTIDVKCGRVVVPSGMTLKQYLSRNNTNLVRYTFNRYEGTKLIRNKYEFCNGRWEFVGEV